MTSPEGCETAFTYEAGGTARVETWTTPSGYKTTFQYDGSGRVTKVQRPDGVITTTYDTDTMAIQDARGYRTTYTTYASGELKEVINAKNERITYTWENKWPKAIKDGRGNVYTFTYQSLTADLNIVRVKGIQMPVGGIVTYAMDGNDNLESIKDERGYVTTLNWSSGRLSSVQNAKGDLTTYGYTTQYKQLEAIKNPLGKTWTMSYDGTGRKTEDRDPLGNRTSYTHDGAGCLNTVKNPLGKVTTYVFDDMNRLESVKDPNGDTTSYSYEPGSCLLETVTDALGRVMSHSYDTNGRLEATINPLGERTSYSYDAGRVTKKELGNGTIASFSYDAANQVKVVANLTSAGGVISRYTYTYDDVGNRTKVEEGGSNVVDWSYYDTYRLKNEKRSGANAFNTTNTYDAVGNRTVQQKDGALTTVSYDAANQLTTSVDSTGTTTYSYDQAGNLQVITVPGGAKTTYTWDDENRNKKLQLSSGTVSTMTYRYDGLRYKKEVGATTTKFIYDGQNYLAETDGANTVTKVITNELLAYGKLVSQRILLAGSTWAPVYHHYDALGSTRNITNVSQAVANTYTYNSWGELLPGSSETITNLFRWIGQLGYYFDDENDTSYVRARHYDPVRGRWLSQDPIAADANVYRYVGNNPTIYVDPNGMAGHIIGGAFIGCGYGAGYSALLSWATGDGFWQGCCRAGISCLSGAVGGAVGAANPAYEGCIISIVNGIAENTSKQLCNYFLGNRQNVNVTCAVATAVINGALGCWLGKMGGLAKTKEEARIARHLWNVLSRVTGTDIYQICHMAWPPKPPAQRNLACCTFEHNGVWWSETVEHARSQTPQSACAERADGWLIDWRVRFVRVGPCD